MAFERLSAFLLNLQLQPPPGPVEVKRQRPQREGGGKDVRMRQSTLRKPDRVNGRQDQHGGRRGCARQQPCPPEDAQQRKARHHADEQPRAVDVKARELPPGSHQHAGQRRMRIGHGALRYERAKAEKVPCGRNVVAALIPEIGQPQQRCVEQKHTQKDRHKQQRERDGPCRPLPLPHSLHLYHDAPGPHLY